MRWTSRCSTTPNPNPNLNCVAQTLTSEPPGADAGFSWCSLQVEFVPDALAVLHAGDEGKYNEMIADAAEAVRRP